MDLLKGLLTTVAPMVATALGGPLAGGAVRFLGQALLGDENAGLESVTKATQKASPGQLESLDAKWKIYEAETKRLIAEQGEVGELIKAKLDTATANKVALMRMTTRPWAVRKMVYTMMLPLYITVVDMVLALLNIVIRFFHGPVTTKNPITQFDFLAATFFEGNSVYVSLYQSLITPAAGIVIAYMGLRQIEKSGNPLSGIMKLFGKS